MGDTFRSLHMTEDSSGTWVWITPVAKQAWEDYETRLEAIRAEVGEDAEIPVSQKDFILGEILAVRMPRLRGDRVVGIGEHGRSLLGLGSHSRTLSSSFSSTGRDPSQQDAVSRLTEETRIASERAARAKELAAKATRENEELRHMILSIQSRLPLLPTPSSTGYVDDFLDCYRPEPPS